MVQRGRRTTKPRGQPHYVRRRIVAALIVFGGFAALFVTLGSLAEHVAYAGRVLPGVQVDGTHVATKGKTQAHDAIARLGADLDQAPLHVRTENARFILAPSAIGYDVDADATAAHAEQAGRHDEPWSMIAGTIVRRLRPDHVPLVVHYDPARLDSTLASWAGSVDQGVVEGGLRFDGTTVVPVMPHAGNGIQLASARKRLTQALAHADRTHEVRLPFGHVTPEVDAAQVEAAAARARALLASNIEIQTAETTVTLTPADLAPTLGTRINGHTLDLTIDSAPLRTTLAPRIAPFETPPVDATFTVNSDNTVNIVPSRDGRELDVDAIAADILAGKRTIAARVRNAHPAHDTAWAQQLGITRQVSTFTTNHPSGQPRVHNIHVAADVLNNTVVEPGQVFSLNDKLGPRTPEKGYVKAPILIEDGFGEDYGGGVSQLTTTLYNAVFFGGYQDVEHTPHHFYISRYPMGREATINYGSIDFKFRDDTSHGVLIHTNYSATSITVTLFGDNDGRVVHEENRHILHTEPITDQLIDCPAKKATDDPGNDCAHLSAGTHYTAQTGETGYDVEFDRVIEQPGHPTRREHQAVHYPMLQNKVLVGTAPPAASSTTSTSRPRASTTTTVRRH
jgi:vancomycin resistance protein YoaR